MHDGIRFAELLEYTEEEHVRWKAWFAAHQEALELPCDIAGSGTVRRLVLHIFVTELVFSHAVLGLPKPDWEKLACNTLEELFSISEEAGRKFAQFLASATSEDWNTVSALGFGDLKASRRKMLAQALLHGVHHRAQLATFLRQQGFDGLWVHDIILSKAMS
jgi:uncharacterized damage-inducible protein DinB